MSKDIICPNCGIELELSEDEVLVGRTICPNCEVMIDFASGPPVIIEKENYVELLSSFNQGDIGLIKSILDNFEIDYYVFGENFLSINPLIQPVKFFVNEKQIEEAKGLLKNIDLNIWGVSRSQYD